jgi:hypothetical protein
MDLQAKNPSDVANIDQSMPKIIVLAVLGIAFASVFSYFLNSFFTGYQLTPLAISVSALVGFLVIFLLQSLFIKSLWRLNLIIFLESGGLMAGFYERIFAPLQGKDIDIVSLILFWVVFVLFIWANYSGIREMDNFLKVRFWRLSKVVLPKAIASVALFVSVLFVFPSSPLSGGLQLPISSATLEKFLAPASGILQKLIPGFDTSLSINELTRNLAEQQIAKMPETRILPQAARQQLILKTTRDFEGQIANIFGSDINPKLKISDIAYKWLKDKFEGLAENSKLVVMLAIAGLLFLTIEGIAMPLRWLVSVIAFVIYEILKLSGFATVALEGKSREVIILK